MQDVMRISSDHFEVTLGYKATIFRERSLAIKDGANRGPSKTVGGMNPNCDVKVVNWNQRATPLSPVTQGFSIPA